MCGIIGIISPLKTSFNIKPLLDKLNHRGPDNTGFFYWTKENDLVVNDVPQNPYMVSFGHKRLSILDLSDAGTQPFSSSDGRWQLTYNGEVYNYLELREELQEKGLIFHTESDTEVVLAALIFWGVEYALKRFQGMFALGLLDTQTSTVYLARDAFGIKPLFYCEWKDGFGFASEIKALTELPDVNLNIDLTKVNAYLVNGRIDNGPNTLLKGVMPVEPGSFIYLNVSTDNKIKQKKFWDPDQIIRKQIEFEEAAKTLRELFLESIKLHLRSDVPFGVALSGGLDSSSIVCCIRYLYPEIPIHTFSFVPFSNELSEENYIDIINEHVGAISHKVKISDNDLRNDLIKLIKQQDEPFNTLAIYSQYRVFQLAKENNIKVMLDGQGADELMAGYAPLQGVRLASLWRSGNFVNAFRFLNNQQNWLDRTVKSVFLTSINQIFFSKKFDRVKNIFRTKKLPRWINKKWLEQHKIEVFDRDYLSNGPDYLRDVLKKSLSNGLVNLLRYEDRNSMAHSIESRVPFLTTKLAEFVLSLPEEYLIDIEGGSKVLFRRAMRGIVPDAILDRKEKKGFATPDYDWLNANRDFIFQLIENIPNYCFLNTTLAKDIIKKGLNTKTYYSNEEWRLLNFLIWMNENGYTKKQNTAYCN